MKRDVLSKFDKEAMINPKTEADIVAILRECISEVEFLDELWSKVFEGAEGKR